MAKKPTKDPYKGNTGLAPDVGLVEEPTKPIPLHAEPPPFKGDSVGNGDEFDPEQLSDGDDDEDEGYF